MSERKVVKVYRWRILRSQIRHRGFFFWLLRKVRRRRFSGGGV